MKNDAYAVVFVVLASLCVGLPISAVDVVDWFSLLFAYPALSFLLLAVAYAGVGPGLFAKQPTGRLTFQCWLLFAPYFLLNGVIFRLHCLLNREPVYAEVVPNLFFGRRLTERESREAVRLGWLAVLDLAPEFAEAPSLRKLPGYRSLPVLDASAPNEQQLRDVTVWLTAAVKNGPVYVHCALGHGRTGCVVVAYLLSAGIVKTVAEGVQMLQAKRAGVRLNRTQRSACRTVLTAPDAGFPK